MAGIFSEKKCPSDSQQAAGGFDRGRNGRGGDHVSRAESAWDVGQSPDPPDGVDGRNYRAQVILCGITREGSLAQYRKIKVLTNLVRTFCMIFSLTLYNRISFQLKTEKQ